jgi:hypothetical protein
MSRSPIVPFERKAPSPTPSATRERLQTAVEAMDERSRDVFRRIVEAYVDTGEPVGSRTLSRQLADPLSPATIRNVMADLQDLGLLYSPHISAGRLPTDLGLRLFVDGLLEVGRLSSDEREKIEVQCAAGGRSVTQVLEQASNLLAGLGRGAGLVIAPKSDAPLKHVEFVPLGPGRSLAVDVGSPRELIVPHPRMAERDFALGPLCDLCPGFVHASFGVSVRELLSRGAGVNVRDNDGVTPLILACDAGHLAAATLLLDAGADLALLDNVGDSALRCAERRVELDDEEPEEGAEPPTAAQRREHRALVKLLKARGA